MKVDILEDIDSIISSYINKNLEKKEAIFILGPPNSGKTKYIKENIKNTHLVLDASEIYKKLNGSSSGFTKHLTEEVNYIGTEILKNVLTQKYSFVIEFQLDQYQYIMEIVNRLKKLDYKVSGFHLDVTKEISMKRNKKRVKENISSYFTENYHIAWFLDILKQLGV